MDTEFESIPTNMPLGKIMERIEISRSTNFIVIDRLSRFVGTISLQHILGIIAHQSLANLVIAQDIASTDYISIYPDDNLETAQNRFALVDSPFLPVVNKDDTAIILGVLRRDALVQFYNRKLIESFK